MENAVDPHHTEWLHGRFFEFMARHQGFDAPTSFGKKHVKVGFDAFEWASSSAGWSRRVEEDDDWKIGHPLVFPYNIAGRRGEHRADADPGADRPDHRPFESYTGSA